MVKPPLDSSLKNKGYDWIQVTPNYFADVLKDNKAECWLLEVYASNEKWYRTIKCYYDEKEIEISSKGD